MRTRAATRSATSPSHVPLHIPTLASMGLSRLVDSEGHRPRPRPTAAFGRMAERSKGKDSVTGHWELMGIVLDRPFPTFPGGFPAGTDRRVRGAHRPEVDWQRRWPRAPRSSTSLARCTWRPVSRLSTPRRTACFRSPRTKASCRCRSSTSGARRPTTSAVKGLGLGRVIARPFIGLPGSFAAHARIATTTPCRRSPRRCSIAWSRRATT